METKKPAHLCDESHRAAGLNLFIFPLCQASNLTEAMSLLEEAVNYCDTSKAQKAIEQSLCQQISE